MSKLPREIDQIVWAVAESGDARAVEEFGERYPAYRAELAARIRLVRNLRSSRPYREAPALRLPEAARPRPVNRALTFALGGALLASLAFATVRTIQTARQPVPPPQVQPVDTAPAAAPDVHVKSPMAPLDDRTAQKGGTAPVQGQGPTASEDPFDRSVDLDFEHIKLSRLIQVVAQQARLRLQVAPGFEDCDVSARYHGLSARAVLDDLGQNFGFTLMVQQGNEALLIPALDPNKPPTMLPEGSFSQPLEPDPAATGPATVPNRGQ